MYNKFKKRQSGTPIFVIGCNLVLLTVFSEFFSTIIFAQNNPFGATPAGGVAGQPAPNAAVDPLAGENNIIIRQLIIEDPGTPSELADAIRLCVQLGRTDVARKFINTFQTLTPSPRECSDIQRSINSAFLYEIAVHENLEPDGSAFVKTIREGAISYLRDDARIGRLIDDLGSNDGFIRRQAATELRTCDVMLLWH